MPPCTPCCTLSCAGQQKCNKDKITQVKLDLDATSHSKRGGKPETTTFGVKVPGKYVFRVSEYKGRDSNGLLNSGVRLPHLGECCPLMSTLLACALAPCLACTGVVAGLTLGAYGGVWRWRGGGRGYAIRVTGGGELLL